MYEAFYEPLPDGAAYAARIGLSWPLRTDLETLDAIIQAHQYTVPFENLTPYDLRQVPSLEIPALYEKVVVQRRGGYCYELNALLDAFLRAAGFQSWTVACRITRGKDFVPPMLHRAVLVRLDDGQRYYCDVGYGGPQPAGAIPLDQPARTVRGQSFRCAQKDAYFYALYHALPDGGEERVIEFWPQAAEPTFFVPNNYYSAASPASPFTWKRTVNLTQPDGSIALTDRKLTIRKAGQVTERELHTAEAVSHALLEYFGIPFPAESLRWESK